MGPGQFRRGALMAALFAAYITHDALVYVLFPATMSRSPLWLFGAMGLGASGLLGAWAVLGPRSYWIQVPRMLLLLAAVIAIPFLGTVYDKASFFPSLGRAIVFMFNITSFFAACVLFGTLRAVRGWRILPRENCNSTSASTLRRQFSLRAIFVELLVVSMVMGLLRNVPAEFWVELLDPGLVGLGLIWVTGLLLLQLPIVPIVRLVMGDVRRGADKYMNAAVGCFIIEVVLAAPIVGANILEIGVAVVAIACAYLGVLLTLFMLHLADYRLVTRGSLTAGAAEPAALAAALRN